MNVRQAPLMFGNSRSLVETWVDTLTGSSRWDSTIYVLKWAAKATPAGRRFFKLATSMSRSINHPRYSTPTVMDSLPMKSESALEREYTQVRPGRTTPGNLRDQIAVQEGLSAWPTPTSNTRPNEGNVRLLRAKVQRGELTEADAMAMLGKSPMDAQGKIPSAWPTPTTDDAVHRHATAAERVAAGRQVMLRHAAPDSLGDHPVRPWPTPTVGGGGNTCELIPKRNFYLRPSGHKAKLGLDQAASLAETGTTKMAPKLHGRWVLALMGYPPDWCDLEQDEA